MTNKLEKLEAALGDWSKEEVDTLAEIVSSFRPIVQGYMKIGIAILALNESIMQLPLSAAVIQYLREATFPDERERERVKVSLNRFLKRFGHGRNRETLLDLLRTSPRDLRLLSGIGRNTLEDVRAMLAHFGLEPFRAKF